MPMRLHPWFVAGGALFLGAVLGRHTPHPIFVGLIVGSLCIAIIGIVRSLKEWDG
jgi:hypothetical protein